MRLMTIAAAALLLACKVQDPKPLGDLVPVAKSPDGTYPLPIADDREMTRLQGLGVTPAPTIRIVSPRPDEVVSAGAFKLEYKVENYDVGKDQKGDNRHVHVILDHAPYKADYSGHCETKFDAAKELTEGTHTIVLFLARQFHLSLKNPEAFDMVTFHVGRKTADGPRPADPMLVFSRPKGQYRKADGSAEYIMLDFYLRNVKLSRDGTRVRARVTAGQPGVVEYPEKKNSASVALTAFFRNGYEILIYEWKPVIVLERPDIGKYQIEIELVDRDGKRLEAPMNGASRTIEIVP